jgi:hypothetical protein
LKDDQRHDQKVRRPHEPVLSRPLARKTGCSPSQKRRFRALAHRDGVPYELERVVCSKCAAVIAERTVRRAGT